MLECVWAGNQLRSCECSAPCGQCHYFLSQANCGWGGACTHGTVVTCAFLQRRQAGRHSARLTCTVHGFESLLAASLVTTHAAIAAAHCMVSAIFFYSSHSTQFQLTDDW